MARKQVIPHVSIPDPRAAPASISRRLLLAILPIALLLVSHWESVAGGARFERGNYDPEYQYLLNGLKILEGHAPDHIDHPGTTLQLLVALVLKMRYALTGPESAGSLLREDVLLNPESYLDTVRAVVALIMAGTLFLIPLYFHAKTGHLGFPIAFQLLVFVSPSLLGAPARVWPEPMLIITVLLITPLLLELVEAESVPPPTWQPCLLGVLLGAGLVTKLNFLPLLLTVLWLPRWRERALALLALIGSVLLLTLPIWSHAARLWQWIAGLTVKLGPYGSGEGGILPAPAVLVANVMQLAGQEPIYVIGLGITIVLGFLLSRNRTEAGRVHRAWVHSSLAVLFFGGLMAAKFGHARYLVPELAFLGTVLLTVPILLRDAAPASAPVSRAWNVGGAVALTVLAVWGSANAAARLQRQARLHEGTVRLNTRLAAEYPDCTVIPFYGASDQRYGLLLANDYTAGYFAAELGQLYEGTLGYHVWGARFHDFETVVEYQLVGARVQSGECLLLRGIHPFDLPGSEHYNARLRLERLILGDSEIVYRLQGITP